LEERYRVGFYNNIPDSTGHDHHVCQREIEVTTDGGRDQTIAEGIQEFERHEHVSRWSIQARTIECVCLDPED
jgi:hypothetical protein